MSSCCHVKTENLEINVLNSEVVSIHLPLMCACRNLQRTVSDRGQLRYLTGEWFYETKQLRHQDRIHGSDIIRASMKHTYKPLTICESTVSCIISLFHEHGNHFSNEHNVFKRKLSLRELCFPKLFFLPFNFN